MNTDTLPEYLTTAEVAEVIRRSPDYVTKQCKAGALRAKKLGNSWRIHRDDLRAFMGAGSTPVRRSRPISSRSKRRAS